MPSSANMQAVRALAPLPIAIPARSPVSSWSTGSFRVHQPKRPFKRVVEPVLGILK